LVEESSLQRRSARFLLLAVVWAASLGLARPALASTHIAGTTYNASTTWTVAGSPYVLDGNVVVASGATLTVEPGVIVKFNGEYRTLYVDGALRAIGSASSRIVFTSLQDDTVGGDSGGDGPTVGAPGQWYSIAVGSGGMLSAFSYADLRYGGTGSGNWAYGELAVGDAGTFVHVDHSSFTYSGSSGIKLGLYGSADVSASTISHNGNGISANTASVNVSGHTVISNNSQNGLWFNLPSGYSIPASSIVDSDVTGNGDNGIYIGANGDYPLAQMPWGTRDNIYGNAGGGTQLATSGYPGFGNAAVNWTGNYWGPGVYYYYNPLECLSTSPYAGGRLAYRSSAASPPDGPIGGNTYLILKPYPEPSVTCAYDRFDVEATEFSPTYIDGTANEPLGQSFGDCGVDDEANVEALNQTSCEADVNASSGGFTRSETDLSLAGIGIPFALTRSYNSLDRTLGPLGRGWTFSYGAQLGVLSNGDVAYRSGTGQQLIYAAEGGGGFTTPPGARASLTSSGGVYDLARYDQVHERFDSSGRLLSIKDRNSQGLTFTYNGGGELSTIQDSAGRSIALTYDSGSGLLTHVGLPDGRGVSYGYTGGLLSSVTDARGGTTT
jgi:YD repeat-containing protein